MARLFASMFMAFILASGCRPTSAEEPEDTQLVVKVPSDRGFNYAEVTANGRVQTVQPGGEAHFSIPAKAGDSLAVQVRLVGTGLGVKMWDRSVHLNGSGHVQYVASLSGTGIFAQWPLVTFQGSQHLDVWIDNAIKGTTEINKGVAPQQEHTFEWKDGNTTVCATKVTLPADVTRVYLCDVATKKVKQL